MNDDRLTITDVAKAVGVTPRTIMRWEKTGKIKKSKRDWRGWRFYYDKDVEEIRQFLESSYEYDSENGGIMGTAKKFLIVALAAGIAFST